MVNGEVKILGLSGSIRHGNTEILVQEALKAAAELPNVATDYLALADLKVAGGCTARYTCWRHPSVEHPCRDYKEDRDDVNRILRAMMAADGIVVGVPVYWGSIPAQFKCVIDRSMAVEGGFLLRNKVGGAIAVAAERHGGHELAIETLHRWFMIHDMIICGVGPERPATSLGGHQGAMAVQGFPYPVHSDQPGENEAVRQDPIGMGAAHFLGRRVAEMARIVKTGLEMVPQSHLAWPKGRVGSEVFDRAEVQRE
jgi:multimeric flavodoxin WrbA